MAKSSVLEKRPAWRGRLLLALAEAEDRFKHALMDVEERELLRERILRIKRRLATTS